MDVSTAVIVVSGLVGSGLVIIGPVVALIALKDGRDGRWLRRYAVSPCVALRAGAARGHRFSVYGTTVPGPGGPMVAPLSGAEAVWVRVAVCSVITSPSEETTRVALLSEWSGGDPFGVADETGRVAVSGRLLQRLTDGPPPSLWTRTPVGSPGPGPVRTVVREITEKRHERGPLLQQAVDRGLVDERVLRRAREVELVEEIIPPGVPLHVVGKPAVLAGGGVGLTLPGAGRYLILSQDPAETEGNLTGDARFGMGCAIWALLIGGAFLAVFIVVVRAISH